MRVGRFGWKAQHASLLLFAGDASVNEMGSPTASSRTENLQNGLRDGVVEDVADDSQEGGRRPADRIMRFLAAPQQLPFTTEANLGEHGSTRSVRTSVT